MTTRIADANGRWAIADVHAWSETRSAWEKQEPAPLPGLQVESIFTTGKYLGQGTVWTRDVTSMPLAFNSAELANWMWTQTPTRFNSATGSPSGAFGGKTAFNHSLYGTPPIVACVVDSTAPGCRFQYMDTCAGVGMTVPERDALILGPIPWPTGLVPPSTQDKGLAIYDKGTGIMREYFYVQPVPNKPGHWTATTGAYSLAKPHFVDLAQTNYATTFTGSNNVVQMHNSLGFVGVSEVRAGVINHALAYTMANAVAFEPASWPGRISDGKFPPASWSGWAENGGSNGPYPGASPRHGQWGRLPMSVDPMFNPRTGTAYKPMTRLLIRAAQQYGLCGTDTNAWCHGFNGESGTIEKLSTGVDPWTAGGELAQRLNSTDPTTAFDCSDFPWDLTQWAPIDWGRPNPDFRLRPGETSIYEPH